MFLILSCLLVFSLVIVFTSDYQKPKSNEFKNENQEVDVSVMDEIINETESENSKIQETTNVQENIKTNTTDTKNPDQKNNSNSTNQKINQNEQSKNQYNEQVKSSNKNVNNNHNNQSVGNSNDTNNEVKESKDLQVCSNNNSNFVKFLNNWKAQNPYSLVFYSVDKLDSYIEKATKVYGYGAWKSAIPIVYKDDECTISFYNAMLYIPKTSCVDSFGNNNEKMYIEATLEENLINKYQYLTNKGFVCEGKVW